ncbi:MAG: hypothetical protein H6R14_2410 [Proteobacteria bacterium]|nr:hypothetical protein [Pseudomonadota bacterium]
MKKQEQPRDDAAPADAVEQARGAKLPPDLSTIRLKPPRDLRISSPPDSTDFQPVDRVKK